MRARPDEMTGHLVAAVVIEYERRVKASGEGDRGVAHANFSKELDRTPAGL